MLAYPVSVNKDTWAKLPDSVKTIIEEEMDVYQQAVEDESEVKYETALDNLRKQGVTVRDLGDTERKKMAKAIEPWVNQKADEYNEKGYPGDETFRRLIVVAKEHGATPVYEYNIE